MVLSNSSPDFLMVFRCFVFFVFWNFFNHFQSTPYAWPFLWQIFVRCTANHLQSPSITKRHLNQGILNCIYKHFVTGASRRITKLISVCTPIAISWKCGVSQCVLKKCQQNWKVSCHEAILKERNQDKRLRYSNIHKNWAESVKTFLKRWIQI